MSFIDLVSLLVSELEKWTVSYFQTCLFRFREWSSRVTTLLLASIVMTSSGFHTSSYHASLLKFTNLFMDFILVWHHDVVGPALGWELGLAVPLDKRLTIPDL